MSETPRTDEKEFKLYDESLSRPCSVVRSSFARQLEAELADKDKQLAEARARIDHLERIIDEMTEEQAALCAEGQSITELVAAKDKLIEQMVGALNHCKSTFEDYVKIHKAKMPVVTIGPIPPNWGDIQRKIARNQEAFDLCNAALSAAERGE